MGTLWISRMCKYVHTPLALESAKQIILLKVRQQFIVIKNTPPAMSSMDTTNELLLYEGRVAQTYWKQYKKLLPAWSLFISRKPRGDDAVNRLLDIGYHHLATHVSKICATHNISYALGVMHTAKTEGSKPLVYDLMEMFRADIIDKEVLRFFRMKKKPVQEISQREISHFLKRVNRRFERKIYIKEFRQCHTYHYYMDLQIMKFAKAVNHKTIFEPIILPSRHESRCT